jgi:HlyD family secretion protein
MMMLNFNKLQKLQEIINHDKLKKLQEIMKKRPTASAAGIIILVLLIWGIISLISGESAESSIPTYTVKQGPLQISITETGTIQPKEKIIVQNQVEGQTTIVYLLDEGTEVKKGDLMMELDSSTLSDKKIDQEIQVMNAEASRIDASENNEVAKNQAQSDIESAKLNYDFAVLDLKKYNEGEYKDQLREAESNITIAEEELAQAEGTLGWSEKLYKEGYLSQSELEKDTLSKTQKQLALEMKKAAKDLLVDYTHKRQLAKLESDVNQAKAALERTTRKAKANVAQAEANKLAKQAGYEQQVAKLLKIESQIEKTKIYAPADGTIIYATSAEMSMHRFGSRTEPLKVGNSVRERQELIHLPTTSGFIVSISIPESSLDKVKVGLPARVTMDTIPNVVYSGTVTSVASVVNAQNAFMNPDLKTYDTVITLENGGKMDLLRSGMSCKAEIIVDQYEDAVYIPVQAVMSVGGKPTVYMVKGDKIKQRTVETGLDNNIVIRITSGLEPGEIVSLSPPLAQAAVVEQSFEKLSDVSMTPASGISATSPMDNRNQGSGSPPVSGGNNQGSGPTQGGNMPSGQGGSMPSAGSFISRFDNDNDGRISKSEFQGPENFFSQIDKNGDGYISTDEVPQPGGRPGGSQTGQGNNQSFNRSSTQGQNQDSQTRYSTTGSISDSDSSGGPPGDFGGGGPPGDGPGGF